MRLFVLGTALALMTTPAFADGMKISNWYAGVQGGVSIQQDADLDADTSAFQTEFEADTGFAVGAFLGYRLDNGIRLEGEVTHRRNSADTLTVTNDAGLGAALGVGSLNGLGLDLDGHISSTVFMANLWFEPKVGEHWLPYIGGGVGGAHISADVDSLGVTLVDDSDTVFAGQVGAGVGYALQSNIILSMDYRFLVTKDPSLTDEAGGSFDGEYLNHSIMVGLRGHF